jgi:predicted enzyme related to lactoylglutathione lyase
MRPLVWETTNAVSGSSFASQYNSGIVVYFPVDDVDSALARTESLGGTRALDPTDTPVSRIAVFTDPDGNRVGVVQPLTATTTPEHPEAGGSPG